MSLKRKPVYQPCALWYTAPSGNRFSGTRGGFALYIIDRFEEGVAIVEREDGRMLRVPRESLPPDAREGDALRLRDGNFMPDPEATRERRERVAAIKKRLLDKKQGGQGDA